MPLTGWNRLDHAERELKWNDPVYTKTCRAEQQSELSRGSLTTAWPDQHG